MICSKRKVETKKAVVLQNEIEKKTFENECMAYSFHVGFKIISYAA